MIYYFNAETLQGTFNSRRCADYYNDPSLLEADIRQVLLTSGGQEWIEECSIKDIEWKSDFKLLLRNFVNDKALDYGVLEKWCRRPDYEAIDHKAFEKRDPEPSKTITNRKPTFDLVRWEIEQTDSTITVSVVEIEGQRKDAILKLIFSFLFYNFHALQARAVNYKLDGGFCQSERCGGNLYLSRKTGSKTKFCSEQCKTFENVRTYRRRRKEGNFMQA